MRFPHFCLALTFDHNIYSLLILFVLNLLSVNSSVLILLISIFLSNSLPLARTGRIY